MVVLASTATMITSGATSEPVIWARSPLDEASGRAIEWAIRRPVTLPRVTASAAHRRRTAMLAFAIRDVPVVAPLATRGTTAAMRSLHAPVRREALLT